MTSFQLELFKNHSRIFQETRSKSLVQKLVQQGHGDFLKKWRKPNQDLSEKREQLRDLLQCDRELKNVYGKSMGGLPGYLTLIRSLIENLKGNQGGDPSESFFLPPTVDFRKSLSHRSIHGPHSKAPADNSSILKAEQQAIEHIDKIGLVLVAGGLGERLGSQTTKVSLKIHYLHHPVLPDDTFLDFYLKTIVTLQNLYRIHTGKTTEIPLLIMCSEYNLEKVRQEVKAHYNWGIRPRQVVIDTQMNAPCVENLDGNLASEGYRLIKKPLGHGFIHTLIHRKGYLDRPIMQSKKYLFFLQDTNPQSINTLLLTYSHTRSSGYAMSWIAVKRHPGEQAGIIIGRERLQKKQVVNIEYNRLEAGMALPPGKLFANTNNFWLRIQDYRQALKRCHGSLPFIINPKPIPGSVSTYKPFRPEVLMQDIAMEIAPRPTPNSIVMIYPRHLAFSPVKKPLPLKVDKGKLNLANLEPEDILYTSLELEINNNRANLEKIQSKNTLLSQPGKETGKPKVLASLFQEPKIILDPAFKLSCQHSENHIEGCTFHPQSLLMIKGNQVWLHGVILKKRAALIIYLHPNREIRLTVEGITIADTGLIYSPLTSLNRVNEEERNRGYKTAWKKPVVIQIEQPGNYYYGVKGLEKLRS